MLHILLTGRSLLYVNYNESVHMRLSKEQKEALTGISGRHKVSMSTALRWMIDYCLTQPHVLDSIVPSTDIEEGVSLNGIVQEK